MKNSLFFVSLVSFTAAASPMAPIKGPYLDEAQIPKGVCKLNAQTVTMTYEPVADEGEIPLPAYSEKESNVTYCSATLIAPDAVLTAAHCFVGNIEQENKMGTFLYPKMVNGVRIQGCEGPDWSDKKQCIAGAVKGRVKTKLDHLSVACPAFNGGDETRELTESQGWPNPRFSANKMQYDVTVWKFSKPILNSTIFPVELDPNAQIQGLKQNWSSCKSFGYGLDNDEKSGTLHGAVTPITGATEMAIVSDVSGEPDDFGRPILGGHTDHGDSGGPLLCEGADGTTKLYGVVSYGKEGLAPGTTTSTTLSFYSSPAYNALWIKKVLRDATQSRDLSSAHPWYNFAMDYEVDQMQLDFAKTQSCIESSRQEMGKHAYKGYKMEFQKLNQVRLGLMNRLRQGEDPGLILSLIKPDDNLALYHDCKTKAHFGE